MEPLGPIISARQITSPDKTLVKTETITQQEKEKLYEMYIDTYSNIGKNLTSEEFMDKFPEYYDLCYLERAPSGEVQNAILLNKEGNENGVKICLIFGKEDRKIADARVEKIKEMLSKKDDHMYVEASGPLAAVLLKDSKIPVSLVTEKSEDRAHYATVKTRHGKKIVFGYPKRAHPVSQEMRQFYVYLYDYNKIKLRLSPKDPVIALNTLFENVKNSDIPTLYKSILLSKISSKGSEIKPDSKETQDQRNYLLDLLTKANLSDLEENLFAKGKLSLEEWNFLAEMLGGKVDQLREKHLKI